MPYALLSVSEKTGITKFATGLVDFGINLISTGGTALALKAGGVPYTPIEEFTGFPEMFDGRLKTLHPKVHGGILFVRGNPKHLAGASEHGIAPINFVVVNFYPFEKTVKTPSVTRAEVIENIDIGGPAMVRSAAKNHASVTVVIDPGDYYEVLECMWEHHGETTVELRTRLAGKVFRATAGYDEAIANYFATSSTPRHTAEYGKILPREVRERASH